MAVALDRFRNYLVNHALRKYLKTHARQIEKITKGITCAARGELVEHDEVIKGMEAIAQPTSGEDFFNCAGTWEARDIDQVAIRAKPGRIGKDDSGRHTASVGEARGLQSLIASH